jgi:predicted 2-oxoglutarate/Fe(II)-dependent dioxygenase YbiX
MGLRDAFTMRYSMETQKSLGLHTDASLITGSVKLNDNYEGATLYFPRQDFTNLDVPVGSCILFPSEVTHGHYVDELKSGVKYSLTMWTSRYVGDEN